MDYGIRGRHAIVCAASQGLGKGCAMALAQEGVDLVINARNAAALQATAAEIRSATGVTVTDQLPSGVTFRRVATSKGTCTQVAGTVGCAIGTLKKGRTAWMTVKVTASAAGKITNTATVSGDQPDPHMANNSSSVTITVAKAGPCPEHTGDCRSGGGQSALLSGLLSGLRFD